MEALKAFSLQKIGLVLGPLTFFLCLLFLKPEGLSQSGVVVLGTGMWIAIWWITEAVPIAVSALLPILLFPLFGEFSLKETTAAYGDKFIYLFLGGFVLAISLEKWGVHKRIALLIIHAIGSNRAQIILGFMVATAFLSMWISNTATAVMMIPIAMAVVSHHNESSTNKDTTFASALMLSIAYAASIGGISTIIGTPPNLVFVGIVQKTYGIDITFMQWLKVGLPIAILLLIITWLYLTRIAFPQKNEKLSGGAEEIKDQLKALGKISAEEKKVLAVFVLTAFAWIFRTGLQSLFLPKLDDTIIAIASAMVLFVLPGKEKGERLLNWDDTIKLPWGILLLFGGGMALAYGFEDSGLALWLGSHLNALQGVSVLLLLFVIVGGLNFLTEVTSNLAITAMILPVLSPFALVANVHPFLLMVGATLAASCAFMLPVATPPNAVAFGSGAITMKEMVKAGFVLNLLSILLISLFVYFLLPIFWDLEGVIAPVVQPK